MIPTITSKEDYLNIWVNLNHYELERIFTEHDQETTITGYHHYPPIFLKEGIEQIIGSDGKGKKALEWGSGLGFNSLTMGLMNYDTYCVEINSTLHVASRQIHQEVENASNRKLPCNFIQGNYFPQSFAKKIKEGKAKCCEIMNGNGSSASAQKSPHYYDNVSKHTYLEESSNEEDVYKQIPLEEVDLFFGFFWGGEVPPLLELFANHAKQGAKFLFCPNEVVPGLSNYIASLNLQQESIRQRNLFSRKGYNGHTYNCEHYQLISATKK